MAINFPNTPANNEVYYDSTSGNRYIYNGAEGVWKFYANTVGVSVSSTPPSGIGEGSMWWNRDTGRMFVYYNDGSSLQWVETTPAPGSIDSGLVASYANAAASAVYAVANAGFTVANGAFGKANTALQNTTGTFAGTLTVTGNVIAGNVGAGFTPPSGYYFVAGADIARGISVGSDRTTHLRYDNNGLNPIYVKNLGITGTSQGTGINFRIGADGVNEYQSGSVYSVANGLFTSSATANAHLTFGTVLQNNLNEQMRITDVGNVGINRGSSVRQRLDVGGNIIADGYIQALGALYTSNTMISSNADANPLRFGINDIEKMRLTTAGYLTLTSQPKFWINGAASMTAGTTPAKMNFTGTVYDTASGWSDANDRYTAPVTGYYYIYTKINVQASAQTTYVMIYKNGSQYSNGWIVNNQRLDYWVNHIVQLNASDYVEIWISTAAGTTGIDNSGYFGGYLLG